MAGLIALDQSLLRLGRGLMASPYWNQGFEKSLASQNSWDVLILGTCRAFFLKTPELSEALGKRVMNAGVRGARIPTMAANFEIAKPQGRGKPLVLLVDYYVLESTLKTAREEIRSHPITQTYLSERQQFSQNRRVQMPWIESLRPLSGLMSFQGQGAWLRLAFSRWARSAPLEAGSPYVGRDSYTPYLDGFLKVDPEVEKLQMKQATTTEFSYEWLESLLQDALAAGMRPILVVPPMHHLVATQEVNEALASRVKSLASRYDLKVLDYLTHDLEFASQDGLWTEPSHLNEPGTRLFTSKLARDLKGLLP